MFEIHTRISRLGVVTPWHLRVSQNCQKRRCAPHDRLHAMTSVLAKRIATGAALCGIFVVARVANAAPCSALPNPIVIESGDTQEPLLKSLGQKLRNSTATPMTVVYKT